jgi:peptidoglycan/LPS O-acetylase OafA/YrhL
MDQEKQAFFTPLESARGVAAILVAAFHVGQTLFLSGTGIRDQLIAPSHEHTFGGAALSMLYSLLAAGGPLSPPVLFFFVLSGFVLSYSLSKSGITPRIAASFVVRRVFRIYPAVVATILLFWAIHAAFGAGLSPDYSPRAIVRNMLLLSNSINGVMWSLQTELIGSALVLIAMTVVSWLGRRAMIVMCAALVLASLSPAWYHFDLFRDGWTRTAYLHAFLFGSLAWLYGGQLVARLRNQGAALLLCALVFFLALPCIVGEQNPLVVTSRHISAAIALQAAAAAGMVAILAFGRTRAADVLQTGLIKFYGRISFSLYLVQPIILMIIWSKVTDISAAPLLIGQLVDVMPRAAVALLLTLVGVALVTPIAYVFWRYVEMPFSELSKRMLDGSRIRRPVRMPVPRLLLPLSGVAAVAFVAGLTYVQAAPTLPAPCADDFSAATPIAGEAGEARGTNAEASGQLGELGHAGQAKAYHSVWCQWTAPADGNVTFSSAASAFHSVVSVYDSRSLNSMPDVGVHMPGGMDTATVAAKKGETYSVVVDGVDGAIGRYVLRWHAQ